jgi:hypothetical protein
MKGFSKALIGLSAAVKPSRGAFINVPIYSVAKNEKH